jgi:VWFA-related protein
MATRPLSPIVGILVFVAAWSVSGRAEPTRPLVSVPLFVTDVRGESIRNLKAPEIEVSENGAVHKIASIVFRGGAPRRVAFFLDEYHVSPANTERARASIARFVERHLRADDQVVIMKPLDPRAATAPKPSIEAVHRALTQFDGRRGVFEPRSDFEAQYMSTAPPAVERQRAPVARAALENRALSLRDNDTPQALIIVTEGFVANENSRMRTTTLRSIARAARLANAPIYIIDPTAGPREESPFDDRWRAMTKETGGVLFPAGTDLDDALGRIAADLEASYLIEFPGAAKQDGRFHDITVNVKRRGVTVRAPSGYWVPFDVSRVTPPAPRTYANLLTPHVSGLIQPWFRMAPAGDGRTRVTFSWAPRPGRKVTPERVDFSAITFEGDVVHSSTVAPLGNKSGAPAETTFVVPPGPLQVSMAIAAARLLDTDVRYITVPKLDAERPHIASVEFVRPRSLPEFNALRKDPSALPTEARDFLRSDRLLVRVRAFSAEGTPLVTVTLTNRFGHPLMDLPELEPVDGVAQFELPFARFARGEYKLHVRAGSGQNAVTEILTVRVIG